MYNKSLKRWYTLFFTTNFLPNFNQTSNLCVTSYKSHKSSKLYLYSLISQITDLSQQALQHTVCEHLHFSTFVCQFFFLISQIMKLLLHLQAIWNTIYVCWLSNEEINKNDNNEKFAYEKFDLLYFIKWKKELCWKLCLYSAE